MTRTRRSLLPEVMSIQVAEPANTLERRSDFGGQSENGDLLPVIGEAEEGTVICRISVKSFMFPLLLLQVLSISVQVKVAP